MSLEKNDASPSLEDVKNFIQTTKSKATGYMSFTYKGKEYRWEHVLLVEMARMVITARRDDSDEPLNGTLFITFPLTLTAGQSIDFGLGESQAGGVFAFDSLPSLPGLGPVFTLTHSTPGKHYKGTFSSASMLLSKGEFDISL